MFRQHSGSLDFYHEFHTPRRRCDASQPMCASCISNHEPECVYAPIKFRRKRLIVLQGRIDGLEAEVDLLQSALEAAGDRFGSNLQHRSLNITTFSAGNFSPSRSQLLTSRAEPQTSQQSQLFRIDFDPLIGSWWATNEHPPSGLVNILYVGLRISHRMSSGLTLSQHRIICRTGASSHARPPATSVLPVAIRSQPGCRASSSPSKRYFSRGVRS